MDGWIKSYRKMFDNPIVCKDSDHYAVWGYLLHFATHQPYDVVFEGKRITLKSGQLITSRRAIAQKFSISESKVQRILKTFEIEHQIEQQTMCHNRLISLLHWEEYQIVEQQNEQQVNNNRTTSEQQVNTNNNNNNNNNDNNKEYSSKEKEIDKSISQKKDRFVPPTVEMVDNYCKERNNGVDAQRFCDYYASKGWLVGKTKMKDWQAAVRTWERGSKKSDTGFKLMV